MNRNSLQSLNLMWCGFQLESPYATCTHQEMLKAKSNGNAILRADMSVLSDLISRHLFFRLSSITVWFFFILVVEALIWTFAATNKVCTKQSLRPFRIDSPMSNCCSHDYTIHTPMECHSREFSQEPLRTKVNASFHR